MTNPEIKRFHRKTFCLKAMALVFLLVLPACFTAGEQSEILEEQISLETLPIDAPEEPNASPTPFPSTPTPTPTPVPIPPPTPTPTPTPTPVPIPPPTPTPTPTPSPQAGCVNSSSTWQNNALAEQDGSFTVEYDATPLADSIDAVLGFSKGSQNAFADFATLIRFNPNGFFDVIDGNSYRYDTQVNFSSGQAYHFRVEVNVAAKRHSVFVSTGGNETQLANNYTFRSSASETSTSLNNYGLWSNLGAFTLCDVIITESLAPDFDGDGIADDQDNCPFDANEGQEDADQDGAGNACEAACSDGLNNDPAEDNLIDLDDPGCSNENDLSESDPVPAGEVATITPGRLPSEGAPWTGSTTAPGPVGNPNIRGYTEKAMGVFTWYPYETHESGRVRFGVMAFHMSGGPLGNDGIRKVIFGLNQPGSNPNQYGNGEIGNSGAWTEVTQATYNDKTGLYEYSVEVDVDALPANGDADGLYELRAIAYPHHGIPRVMTWDLRFMMAPVVPHWKFFLNPGGTLNKRSCTVNASGGGTCRDNDGSVQSLSGGLVAAANHVGTGGTVYLNEGNHCWGSFNAPFGDGQLLTITKAPGADRENVRLTCGSGNNTFNASLRLKDVRIDNVKISGSSQRSPGALILESIHWVGGGVSDPNHGIYHPGLPGAVSYGATTSGPYAKGAWLVGRAADGPIGVTRETSLLESTSQPITRTTFQLNIDYKNFGGDLVKDSKHGVNLRTEKWALPNRHSDTWQIFWPSTAPPLGDLENFMLVNIDAVASWALTQGPAYVNLSGGRMKNVAFVNYSLWRPYPINSSVGLNAGASGWSKATTHAIVWNSTMVNYKFNFGRGDTPNGTHQLFDVRNNVFHAMQIFNNQDIALANNHHIAPQTYGAHDPNTEGETGATSGGSVESLFIGASNYSGYLVPFHAGMGFYADFIDIDLTPRPGSIIENAVDMNILGDVYGNPRSEPTSLGSFVGTGE